MVIENARRKIVVQSGLFMSEVRVVRKFDDKVLEYGIVKRKNTEEFVIQMRNKYHIDAPSLNIIVEPEELDFMIELERDEMVAYMRHYIQTNNSSPIVADQEVQNLNYFVAQNTLSDNRTYAEIINMMAGRTYEYISGKLDAHFKTRQKVTFDEMYNYLYSNVNKGTW